MKEAQPTRTADWKLLEQIPFAELWQHKSMNYEKEEVVLDFGTAQAIETLLGEWPKVKAELEQVRRERDAWKSASGLESPEELSTMLDTQPLLPDQLTNALSDLAEQGQNLDLAEAWQKRAEAAEQSRERMREALERIEKNLSDPTPYNPEYLKEIARKALEGESK